MLLVVGRDKLGRGEMFSEGKMGMNGLKKCWAAGLAGLVVVVGMMACPGAARAQGSRKDDVVFNAQGRPMAGATVRVCTSAATGEPCSPLALIYSDAALTQAMANPLSADGLGNYTFYAAPGRYTIEISGPGITTKQLQNVILPSDPSSPTFTTVTTTSGISAFSLALAGDLTVNGSTSVAGTLSVGGAPVPSTGADNQWGASQRFKGPDPHFDVTAYGARTVGGSPPSTTADCTASSTSVTLAAASSFQDGDGIVIYGCGATNAMATPTAPTVSSGNSQTLAVPDAMLSTITGSSTYSYKIVAHDKAGGLTVPSSAATITNGPATLGITSPYAIATESLTGNTLTVATVADNGLTVNTLVHIAGSTNAALSGWFNVTGITDSKTFTVSGIPISDTDGTATSTGGSLVYDIGNQLTLTYSAGAWQYYVCAERPGDGSYSVIGVTEPYNTASSGNGAGSLTFTDWGATQTSAPVLPAYVTDSICTAGAATNDYLATQIVSGGGTTSIVVADAASQTATGQTALFDDGYAFRAADAAAITSPNYGGVIFVPNSDSGTYVINSFTDLSTHASNSLLQWGNLTLKETLIPPNNWSGAPAAYSTIAFSRYSTPATYCSGGWPCVYIKPATFSTLNWLTITASGNQSLPLLFDGNNQNGTIRNVNVGTGGAAADYSGIGLIVRGYEFQWQIDGLGTGGGPSQVVDSSWTPEVYIQASTAVSPSDYSLKNISGTGRAIYASGWNTFGPSSVENVYIQGAIMPTITLQSFHNSAPTTGTYSRIHNDTSTQPLLALLNTTGGSTVGTINFERSSVSSVEPGGFPPFISGVAPKQLTMRGMTVTTPRTSNPTDQFTYVNANEASNFNFYANDSTDSTQYGRTTARGLVQNTLPISSAAGVYVPLATPVQSAITVSAGGTDDTGTNIYCVVAVGWSGGWSKSSCRSATLTAGNQTVGLSWAAVPNAQGYVVIENTNRCIPLANRSCTGLSTTTNALTYAGGSSASSSGLNPDTASGAGGVGFDASGLYGPLIKGIEAPAPAGVAGLDLLWGDSAGHGWKKIENNGAAFNVAGTLSGTTASIGGSALAAGECASGTVSVPNAASTMTVSVSPNTYPGDGFIPWGYVSSSGTVTVKVCAQVAGTPVSSTYNVRVIE